MAERRLLGGNTKSIDWSFGNNALTPSYVQNTTTNIVNRDEKYISTTINKSMVSEQWSSPLSYIQIYSSVVTTVLILMSNLYSVIVYSLTVDRVDRPSIWKHL